MGIPHPALLAIARGEQDITVRNVDTFLASAAEHRMSGLVWTYVEKGLIELPVLERKALFETDLAHWAHNERLWSGWRAMTDLGSAIGVEMALFKGVAVESRFYRRTGERPCSDIDVLISPEQTHRIEAILDALDFDRGMIARTGRLIRSGRIQSVLAEIDGVPVDLHVDLFKLGFGSRNPQSIWAGVEEYEGSGRIYQTIEPALSLLHLLVHLNRDRFRRLLGYVDVYVIASSGLVDWDRFWQHARREGLESIASEVLRAVHEVIPLIVPATPNTWSPRAWAWSPRAWAWRRLWPPSSRLSGHMGQFRFSRRAQFFLPFLCKGRTREAIALLGSRLLPPAELVDFHHPNVVAGPYLWRLVRGRWADWRGKRALRRSRH